MSAQIFTVKGQSKIIVFVIPPNSFIPVQRLTFNRFPSRRENLRAAKSYLADNQVKF